MNEDYDFRYLSQQQFLFETARRLGFVYFRPSYHGKDRDANTVMFYTKTDEEHNKQVDKELTQYSRTEAQCYHCTDERYIYRDPFWVFENTDVNGFKSYEFANRGRLDLRGLRWKSVLEGEMWLAFIRKQRASYTAAAGGILDIAEADETYNGFNIDTIAAMKMRYGRCFLGDVNVPKNRLEEIELKSKYELYTEYRDQKLYNFCCDYAVPVEDSELADLVLEWNKTFQADLVDRIFSRVEKLGGVHLLWF